MTSKTPGVDSSRFSIFDASTESSCRLVFDPDLILMATAEPAGGPSFGDLTLIFMPGISGRFFCIASTI